MSTEPTAVPVQAEEANESNVEKRKLENGDAQDEPSSKRVQTEATEEPERASRFSDSAPAQVEPAAPILGGYDPAIAAVAAAAAQAAVAAMQQQGQMQPQQQGGDFKSIVVSCPQSMVGKIIGRSGCTVQGLQDQTGAKIQIDQQKPEGVPRDISVSGTNQQVDMAKGLIDGLLASEGPGMAPMQGGVSGVASETMDLPHTMVGRVIGRGGETIKGLQQQSGAHITIDQNFPEGEPRKITVSGTQNAVQGAIQMIKSLIDGGPSAVSIPGGSEAVLKIEQGVVGKLIGKGGETIKGMQNQTGARIQIDQSLWQVSITGTPPSVESAREIIQGILNGGDPPNYAAQQQGYMQMGGYGAPQMGGYGAPQMGGYGAPQQPAYGGYPQQQQQPAYGGYQQQQQQQGGYGGYAGAGPSAAPAAGGYGGYEQQGQQQPAYGQQPAAGYGQPPAAEPAWQTLYDQQNRPYYYNSATGVSQWEKPPELN